MKIKLRICIPLFFFTFLYYNQNVQIGNIQMTVQKPASVIKRQVKDAIQLLETVCVMTNMVERIVLAIHQ